MAPNPRVREAFRAMKAIGISETQVKPVLKRLLGLYDKNWELIEAENYRVLADAIFDDDDSKGENLVDEAEVHDEPEQPLKRSRPRSQDGQSFGDNSSSTALKKPKLEKNVPGPISSQSQSKSMGEKPGSPIGSGGQQVRHSYKGKEPMLPQVSPREKRPIVQRPSGALRIKETVGDSGIVPKAKQKGPDTLSFIIPKDEPYTDDVPHDMAPLSVVMPASLNKENTSVVGVSVGNPDDQETPASHFDAEENKDENLLAISRKSQHFVGDVHSNGAVKSNGVKDLGDPNAHSLVVAPQHNAFNDLTKGEENVQIAWINEINNQCPPSFHYIPGNQVFQNANVKFSLSQIKAEDCCSTCVGDCLSSTAVCVCASETEDLFAYTSDGLLREDFLDECITISRDPQQQCLSYCKACPFERSKNDEILEPCKGHLNRRCIKECWSKCACHKQCGNRIVQRGIRHKLQVFFTLEGKGWGLRTLEKLPRGTFVCEYVGEILTNKELHERNMQRMRVTTDRHTHPVLLDAYWFLKGTLKDEDALCLDATFYGNVARFINHRCLDANMIEIPVKMETPDNHYYHLAFFTTRDVDALEELTWDYGIDFDDNDQPVEVFRCLCGSKFCRNMKRSSRSKSLLR